MESNPVFLENSKSWNPLCSNIFLNTESDIRSAPTFFYPESDIRFAPTFCYNFLLLYPLCSDSLQQSWIWYPSTPTLYRKVLIRYPLLSEIFTIMECPISAPLRLFPLDLNPVSAEPLMQRTNWYFSSVHPRCGSGNRYMDAPIMMWYALSCYIHLLNAQMNVAFG